MFRALIYSNLWIAASAGANAVLAYRLIGQQTNYHAAWLCFFSMFWVYTFAKAVHFDPEADAVNDPERTDFLKRYRVILISLGLAGLCYGALTTYNRGWWAIGCFLMPTFAGLFYDLKLLPASFSYRRLKDIPGVKGLTVAVAWGWLVAGLVYEFSHEPNALKCLAIGLWTCLLWFINTTYFDLGDVKGDRLEGTRTLPIRLGYSRTRGLLHCLNLCHLAMGAFLITTGVFQVSYYLLAIVALVHGVLLLRAASEETDLQWECDFVADGMAVIALGFSLFF